MKNHINNPFAPEVFDLVKRDPQTGRITQSILLRIDPSKPLSSEQIVSAFQKIEEKANYLHPHFRKLLENPTPEEIAKVELFLGIQNLRIF